MEETLQKRIQGIIDSSDVVLFMKGTKHSNWPTIPQLYVRGKFVGGCDIVREMYEKGELGAVLSAKES